MHYYQGITRLRGADRTKVKEEVWDVTPGVLEERTEELRYEG